MKRPRTVDFKNLKTLYLNRSDRIGDAIISKPFIDLLIRWLRDNGCRAEIIIIASQYNSFVLMGLQNIENNIRIIEEQKNLDTYESKLWRMILKHANFLWRTLSFRWTHGKDRDENILFLDFTGGGDLLTILKYKELHNPVVAGPNIFWGSHILDIAIDHSYVHYPHKNLIESYIEITEKVFVLDDTFRNFVYDNIGEFYDFDPRAEKSGICLFVGVKEFRNLPIPTWKHIIDEVAKAFNDEIITVLDDNTNLLYEAFLRESFPSNVKVEKNTYSLAEFTDRVRSFRFVAGIDGGGINMVRTLTNSCTIYTFALHDVWSCFPGRNKYQESSGKNGWTMGISTINMESPEKWWNLYENRELEWTVRSSTVNEKTEIWMQSSHFTEISNQKVGYIYKKSFWLPTFNIAGNREIFRDFDTDAFVGMIREILGK